MLDTSKRFLPALRPQTRSGEYFSACRIWKSADRKTVRRSPVLGFDRGVAVFYSLFIGVCRRWRGFRINVSGMNFVYHYHTHARIFAEVFKH